MELSPEPTVKSAVIFVDGQNLFHSVRESFDYTYPNYDVAALSRAVAGAAGWNVSQMWFYTGIPDPADDPFWHSFWSSKLAVMGRQGSRYSRAPCVTRTESSSCRTVHTPF